MLAKLICYLMGHRRGKRTGGASNLGVQLKCGRCGAVWNRKVKP